MRFIVDAMHGDLARWLRMLGYDTLYMKGDDWRILKILEKERDRILVTRDRGLCMRARKRGYKCILVESIVLEEKLAQVAVSAGIRLSFDPDRARCPLCNGALERISREEVRGLVPASVLERNREYWRCRRCGKIYWKGSHWKGIREKLSIAREIAKTRRGSRV